MRSCRGQKSYGKNSHENSQPNILVLDNKIIDDVNYNGFPLKNFGTGNGWYSRVTVEECQYLCEISDLCRYFNYVVKSKYLQYENLCELKFGGTIREAKEGNGNFGHKYSSGIKKKAPMGHGSSIYI